MKAGFEFERGFARLTSSAASQAITRQVERSTTTCASITASRALSPVRPVNA